MTALLRLLISENAAATKQAPLSASDDKATKHDTAYCRCFCHSAEARLI